MERFILSDYVQGMIILAIINTIFALSLNLVVGYNGQFSLGHAGFLAVGAYTGAILLKTFSIPFYFAVPLAGLMAGFGGLLVGYPSLRLRGDYLAIATLGFAEIIRILILNGGDFTGGPSGFKYIPGYTAILGLQGDPFRKMVILLGFFIVLLMAITVLVSNYLNSIYGRNIVAIREDELAASTFGVNVIRYKLENFIIGAFLAGIAGSLFAYYQQIITPKTFEFLKSVEVLLMVVLGGQGSITGTYLGAGILTILPEALRIVPPNLQFLKDLRLVFYSLFLIVFMIFRPTGLFGYSELPFSKLFRRFRRGSVNLR